MMKKIKKMFFADNMTDREFVKLALSMIILAPFFYLFVLGVHALFFMLGGGIR